MTYDLGLADRVRSLVDARVPAGSQPTEKPMFGGLGFMVNAHMAVGQHNGGGLIMPIAASEADDAKQRGAVPMEMVGKTASGWMLVPDAVIADDDALAWWVNTGVDAALAKPPKPPRKPK